ncbi:MAG: GNAT family N-acetyltransferase [Methylorubrum populi]
MCANLPFLSHQAGRRRSFATVRDGSDLSVRAEGRTILALRVAPEAGRLELAGLAASAGDGEDPTLAAFAAGIEATLGWYPGRANLRLDLAGRAPERLVAALLDEGLAVADRDGLAVLPALAMQRPDPWLGARRAAYPQIHVMSDGRRHPRRPPKPSGTVYERFIPSLGRTFGLRTVRPDEDLDRFHRWMNDPHVAAFWNEAGEREAHRRYLAALIEDPHMLPLIGSFDGEPFAYFEVYWAKENRLGPFYDAQDYDRGWHVLVGEADFRGRDYIGAWLPSLMHFLFLDDARTQRIVGEPAARHARQIRNLETSGFARIKTFDFPHKRAALVMLLRERFFDEHLWRPARAADVSGHDEAQAL